MTEDLKTKIEALCKLGEVLKNKEESPLIAAIDLAQQQNRWFTKEHIYSALDGIANQFLNRRNLTNWIAQYDISQNEPKSVGLILAGNIPLVGFHDVLSVYISGHRALVKLSSKDTALMTTVINVLGGFDDSAKDQIQIIDRLTDYDAVIATGSNTSGKYFQEYFSKVPNIIRKNRNAVAVLTGSETKQDFIALGEDIFKYFGLGCRNVSKLYVPTNYDFSPLLEALHDEYCELILHHKYKNNFDYNHALFILNKESFLMNGCLMVRKNASIPSRIASVNYEYYESLEDLKKEFENNRELIQCIVSQTAMTGSRTFRFGEAQSPKIDDYADGVDTMQFLSNL